jgi:hypothetical protein
VASYGSRETKGSKGSGKGEKGSGSTGTDQPVRYPTTHRPGSKGKGQSR